ncbi:hypothetical protein GH714_019436 [Hevea brasiliensis]|uniref:NB-ARC domain-containing protein n=1 Tax=Hevea brasiliensis TaxID=3981 RepID=A0A6A6LJ56_HEVBR|nr:hypothetical protein GH714_019436 [Hevea brasiliensis]
MDSEVWELENAEVDIFPHLWLSYNDLSPPLRQCFSYCAIFPKDHLMEKRKLIELWMAHGYIKETTKKDMETIGEEYFQNLASRSFFQDINIDDNFYDISYTCKMHDIVHDFAQYIRRDECFSMEVSSSVESSMESVSNEARYSRIVLAGKGSLPGYFYDAKKLRGLIAQFEGGFVVTAVLSSFFNELTCLRSLDLSNRHIEEIPPTISQLIHLRQLDLSSNDHLKSLPETLCELYNLQTLNVYGCRNLAKLPDGVRKLVNLRHLHIVGKWAKSPWSIKAIASSCANPSLPLCYILHCVILESWFQPENIILISFGILVGRAKILERQPLILVDMSVRHDLDAETYS